MTQLLDGLSQDTATDSGLYVAPDTYAPTFDSSSLGDLGIGTLTLAAALRILGLARAQGKGGAYFSQAGVTVADISAELWRLTGASLASVGVLDLSLQREWTDILSEPGSGSLVVMNTGPDGLVLDGTAGCYASTPDKAAFAPLANLDVTVRVALDDWGQATAAIYGQYAGDGWILWGDSGDLHLTLWNQAGALIANVEVSMSTLVDRTTYWLHVTCDLDNGAGGNDVKFYTAADQETEPSSWTQLGATQTTAATGTSVSNSAAALELGANTGLGWYGAGTFYRAIVRDDIGGTIVADADFTPTGTPHAVAGASTYTDSLGNVWTVNGTAEIAEGLASGIADTGNDLVLFKYKGWAAFMMICETPDRTVIAQAEESQEEESQELTVWAGRGHLALLERGLVYPALGAGKRPIEEDRQFNWTSPSYDDTGWGNATAITSVGNAKTAWNAGGGPFVDADFPDNTASMIWASSGTIANAAEGTCWFRQTISATTGLYRLYFLTDNLGDLYIDGQFLVASTGFVQMSQNDIELSVGTHLIAVRGQNVSQATGNPAAIAWALYRIDGSETETLVAHSDTTSKIVEYTDDPPGMTPGQAMIICLDEMQARGVLTGLTWTFSETADTDGVPWPVVADIATKVGTDVLTFFRELAGTYVDIWMRPGSLILDAWNFAGRGTTQAVTLAKPTDVADPTTGNLKSLTIRGEA